MPSQSVNFVVSSCMSKSKTDASVVNSSSGQSSGGISAAESDQWAASTRIATTGKEAGLTAQGRGWTDCYEYYA